MSTTAASIGTPLQASREGSKYRPDIDGLRAIAVLSVILYHLGIGAFGGGFVGVDVFFVISGFLITALLLNERDGFWQAIAHFYMRRVRRILPALFALLLCAAPAAWWILSPVELVDFSDNVVAAVAFASNIFIGRSGGYFDVNAEWRPLLHLWSLAIEEQFYIVYPAVLFAIVRIWKLPIAWSLGLIGALSLALSIVLTFTHPGAAFYFAPSRAWELLLGGLVYVFPSRLNIGGVWAETSSGLGVALILGATVLLTSKVAYPGYFALFPCLGAAMVIWANSGGTTVVGRILGARAITAVGLISYSLYLWHWPIIVFYKRLALRALDVGDGAVILALTFLTAYLSWRFVERPFRRSHGGMPSKRVLYVTAFAATGLVLAAGAGIATDGYPPRLSAEERRLLAYNAYNKTPEFQRSFEWGKCWGESPDNTRALNCLRWSKSQPNILLWGDSYAVRYYPGLAAQAHNAGYVLSVAVRSACWPVLRDPSLPRDCLKFNTVVHDAVRNRSVPIILVARLFKDPSRIATFVETAERLAREGHTVIVISPRPEYEFPMPWLLARYAATGNERYRDPSSNSRHTYAEIERTLTGALSGIAGVTYISGDDVCAPQGCPMMLTDRTPLAWDRGHFTIAGSQYVARRIWPKILVALQKRAPPR